MWIFSRVAVENYLETSEIGALLRVILIRGVLSPMKEMYINVSLVFITLLSNSALSRNNNMCMNVQHCFSATHLAITGE